MFQTLAFPQLSSSESLPSLDPDWPFRLGEKIVFAIRWKPPKWLFFIPSMQAGQITFTVDAVIEDQGYRSLFLSAEVHSSSRFDSSAKKRVRNRYESKVDLASFCSRQFKFTQREGKKANDVKIEFRPAQGQLHIQKWDVSKDPPEETQNEIVEDVPMCVQDLLSIFYYTRNLPLDVGSRKPVNLSNDRGIAQKIRLYVEKEEVIETGLGKFKSAKIKVLNLFGSLFRSGGNFRIWMETDRKIPIKFETNVKFGRVSGTITQYEVGSESVNADLP